MKIKWKRQIHPLFKECNLMGRIIGTGQRIPIQFSSPLIYKWQYIAELEDKFLFSIVGPSVATQDSWEVYDGKDIARFETLKEAKNYCEKQINLP